jgi:hypothetical protein
MAEQANLLDQPQGKPKTGTKAVAKTEPTTTPAASTGTVKLDLNNLTLNQINFIGKSMAESGMFADVADANQALVKILAGQEIGVAPFQAMTNIHIIKNKATMSANLMAAKVKGNPKYNYRVLKQNDEGCEIEFYEQFNGKLEPIGKSSFTMADAKKAGTQNLDKFPRNMLFSRAMSNGVKWYCPDVFNGNLVYVPEEMGAPVNEDGDVIDASALTLEDQAIKEINDAPNIEAVQAVLDSLSVDLKKKVAPVVSDRIKDLEA